MDEVSIIIRRLIWDEWNIDHISHHGVIPSEVEESLKDNNAVFIKAKIGRVMVLGRSGQRLLAIVLNQQEDEEEFYVITARDMAKKERAFYRSKEGKKPSG